MFGDDWFYMEINNLSLASHCRARLTEYLGKKQKHDLTTNYLMCLRSKIKLTSKILCDTSPFKTDVDSWPVVDEHFVDVDICLL